MTNVELTKKIRDYREVQRLIEEAQAEAETIKDEIKAEMEALGTEELIAGDYKVRWATVCSTRFNAPALKTANPELYSLFTSTTTTKRFTVA